jgi:hypothetical protein
MIKLKTGQMSFLYDSWYDFRGQDNSGKTPTKLLTQFLNTKAVHFLPTDLTENLEQMSVERLLSVTRMNTALEAATEEALARTRSQLAMMTRLFECLDVLGCRFGPLRFDFIAQQYSTNARAQAFFLVLLLHLESVGYHDQMMQVFDAVSVNWHLLKRGQAIRNALEQELPDVARELLAMERIPELTPEEIDAHYVKLGEVYERYSEDLTTFCSRHPEWKEEPEIRL